MVLITLQVMTCIFFVEMYIPCCLNLSWMVHFEVCRAENKAKKEYLFTFKAYYLFKSKVNSIPVLNQLYLLLFLGREDFWVQYLLKSYPFFLQASLSIFLLIRFHLTVSWSMINLIWHEIFKQDKCISLAPPMGNFYTPQPAVNLIFVCFHQ